MQRNWSPYAFIAGGSVESAPKKNSIAAPQITTHKITV